MASTTTTTTRKRGRGRGILWLGTLLLRNATTVEALSALSASENSFSSPPQQRRQESLHVGHHPLLSLNLNLDALTRAEATDRAQELYQRIFALHEEGYYATSPDIVSFNTVLKGYQADPVKAIEFWEHEIDRIVPNTRSYNTVLLALARAGLHEECLKILRQMEDPTMNVLPDSVTYNTVLLSYTTSRESQAPVLAEKLLEEMIAKAEEPDSKTGLRKGLAPDTIAYNTVITGWSQRREADRAHAWLDRLKESGHSRPDVYTYTCVIQVWAKIGEVDRALGVLEEMKAMPSTHSFPNKLTYTAIAEALCQQCRMEEAHKLVNSMWESSVDNQPDAVTYSILLQGWAKTASSHPELAMEAVERILHEMMTKSSMAPNVVTYTLALRVFAQARHWEAPPKAQALFRRMSVPPTLIHYNALLDVNAKAPRADKAVRCGSIWNEMQNEKGVHPDRISYNTIIAAAANAFGDAALRRKSLDIGLAAYKGLESIAKEAEESGDKFLLPTSLSFSFFFRMIRKCGASLSETDRHAWIRRAFAACCRYGCLNSQIWEEVIQQIPPRQMIAQYMGVTDDGMPVEGKVDYATLPSKWSARAMVFKNGSR
jgi:pentatricopeptide repeat protein